MPEVLQVHEEALGDAHLIAATGEIDQVSSRLVADALRRATLAGDGSVVLDMSETNFIDSAGISTLLNGLRRLTRQSRKLIVVCPPGPPRRGVQELRPRCPLRPPDTPPRAPPAAGSARKP